MQTNKKKIAFLDFCGTMIPFQSADAFVVFAIQNSGKLNVKIRYYIFSILRKFYVFRIWDHFIKTNTNNKTRLLRCLQGMHKKQIYELAELFYEKKIKSALIPEMLNEVTKLQQDGYELWFVSGAYNVYLEIVARYLNIEEKHVLCSTLSFSNDIFTGKLDGLDCMGENKVLILQEHIDKSHIQSVAYSDSSSDIPLLKFTDKGVVLSQKPQWIKNNHFDELDYYV